MKDQSMGLAVQVHKITTHQPRNISPSSFHHSTNQF